MSKQIEKKEAFIKAWFNNEKSKLSFSQQLKLAKTWIKILIDDEQYEMAAALQKERVKLIKEHVDKKRKDRTFSEKMIVFKILFRRKLRKLFKFKQ